MHRFTLLLLFLGAVLFTDPASGTEYVRNVQLAFPTNGSAAHTQLPLEPGHKYEITVTSAYSFRPLLDHDCTMSQKSFLFIPYTARDCNLPIRVNGGFPPTVGRHREDLGLYFLDDTPRDHHTSTLKLYVWGAGRPLILQTTRDFSYAVPHATVEVTDLTYEEEQARRERERQEALRRQQQEYERLERERREAAALQRAARALEIEREQQRLIAEQQAREHAQRMAELRKQEVMRLTLLIGTAVILTLIVVALLLATADSRRRHRQTRRAARLTAAQRREQEEQEQRAREQHQAREAQRQQRRAERQREKKELDKEVLKLRLQRQVEPFDDPHFRDAYAKSHARRIMGQDE